MSGQTDRLINVIDESIRDPLSAGTMKAKLKASGYSKEQIKKVAYSFNQSAFNKAKFNLNIFLECRCGKEEKECYLCRMNRLRQLADDENL